VNLDDPVQKYLPEFANVLVEPGQKNDHAAPHRPGHPLTVREILSHTSGLRFLNAKDKMVIDSAPLAESVQHDLLEPLLFEPGSGYKYSNEGIDTAGLIIQVVSGMAYETFLQQRLFTPLEMKDTTFFPSAAQVARLAKSYKPDAAKSGLEETRIKYLKYPLDGPGRYSAPGGGLFSTAADVARFCQMLLNWGVYRQRWYLSEAAIAEMTKKQTGVHIRESYGLGFSVGAGTYGHGGANATNMSVDTRRGIVRVFMVQHVGFPGDVKQMHAALSKAVEQVLACGPRD
jgi:CubicO group peptidase (beta-lactamase class C family)